jgi:hypothetical protein
MKHFKQLVVLCLLVFTFTFMSSVANAQVLSVPECTQEYDQWCWAGSSWSVLQYYGNNYMQCEIAEYTRTHSTFHDFGSVDCCLPSSTSGWACNYWNYNYDPDPGSIKMILIDMPTYISNPSIDNYGVARMLTESEVATEIAAGRPFVIRICCGGHFVVGMGYQDGNLYYMDPWYGEGYGFGPYGSNVNGRDWTHTNIITLDPVLCFKPANPVATNITETAATISWDAVDLADSYDYRYKKTADSTWITGNTTATSQVLSNLSPATEYEFQLSTNCPGESSGYTASEIFNTDGCDTPTGLNASNIGENTATISWAAVPEGTDYDLSYKMKSASVWTTTNTTNTQANLTGLNKATDYEYKVRTVCSGIGNSAYTVTEIFRTGGEPDYCASSGGPGSYLDRVQVGNLDNSSGAGDYSDFTGNPIALDVGSNSYTLHTGSGTNYFMLWIDYNGDGEFTTDERLVSYGLHYQTSGTITIPDISVTTRMRVSVKANSSQSGPCDTFSSGEVEDYTVIIGSGPPTCNIPTGLQASNVQETSTTLYWTAVSGAASYDVRYKKTADSTWTTQNVTATSLDLTNLTAATQYEFQVMTNCSSGSSAYSSSETFTTASTVTCDVPVNLSSSNITATSATLSWDAVSGASSYDINYKPTAGSTWTSTSSTTNTKDISGLSADTQYEFQVRTVCASGTSAYSSSSIFTTLSLPTSGVQLLGSWVEGLSHAAETGGNRCLVFTVHTEDNDADMNVTAVTYGGQAMTKVTDVNEGTGYRSYSAVFVLDEVGIAAAGSGDFAVTWAETSYRAPSYASAFYANVDQNYPVGDTATNGNTSSTVSTSVLTTNNDDMVLVVGACGNTGTYTVNNGFTEALELSPESGDGVVGYKEASGADETPSLTHSNVNRQVIIGLVIQAPGGNPPDSDPPAPDPMTWASVPTATGSSSISMTATTATDVSGVEYYFECLTTGGHDSGWQDSATYEDTGLAASTQYTYHVKARDKSVNQNETAYSTSLSATTDAGSSSQYCDSYGQDDATYIDYVEFGSFTNSSGSAGYTDFTNLTVNMTAGGTVNFRVEKGDTNTSHFKGWIDYNNDGDFDDAGEEVFSLGLYNNYCYGWFTVPSGLDVTTRMRISVKRNSSQGPCDVFSYGEVEDYTVRIQ